MPASKLRAAIAEAADEAGAQAAAVALYDYETGKSFSYEGGRYFHAASTIKIGVLVALMDAVEAGRFRLADRLHVRNRFLSAADATPFRIATGRDANSDVHAALGKTMKLRALAYHMIVTSSNLATNLLLDLVGQEAAAEALARHGVEGVRLARGVEDEKAFEAGLNNEVSADGLVSLLRLIHDGDGFSDESRKVMLDILFEQAFKSGIPAGLPGAVREEARIAHKTGEISTVQHDAGLIFLPDREPYALAVLTEWDADVNGGRAALVARLSGLLYETFIAPKKDG